MDLSGVYQSNPSYSGSMQDDPSAHGYQPDSADPMNLQLTPEELRTLKECQFNAVVQRGLPLGAVTLGSFYYLMKTGVMKRSKVSLAVSGLTGFLLGTMSYRQVCIDKLLALPHSSLKERILAAQGIKPHVRVEVQPQQDGQSQIWSDQTTTDRAPMGSSLDIDIYSSHRFDDIPSMTIDTEAAYAVDPPLQPTVGAPYQTYDDLRRRNREEYESKRTYGFRAPEKTDTMRRLPNDPQASLYDTVNDPTSHPRRSDDFIS